LFATLFALVGRHGATSVAAGTPFYVAACLTLAGTLVIVAAAKAARERSMERITAAGTS